MISSKGHSFYHIKAESRVSLSGLFQFIVSSWIISNILGLLLKNKEEKIDVGKQRPINASKERNSDENVHQRVNLLQ